MPTYEKPRLFVFLGNSGPTYARTRHNIGWLLLEHDLFSGRRNWQRKFKGVWTKISISGVPVALLKPLTMMNLSGESVQAAMRYFRLSPGEVLVAHDDVELGFGQVGIRMGGGLAGHNGLRSIAKCVATRDFWRLRIGVGRPIRGDLHAHVLGRFAPEEEIALSNVLDEAAGLIQQGLQSGF